MNIRFVILHNIIIVYFACTIQFNINLISTLERDWVTGLSECFFFFDFLFFRLRFSLSLMASGESSLVFFLYLYSESVDS